MKDYCLGLYEKSMPADITWEERFCAAREAGFDFIELSVDESPPRMGRAGAQGFCETDGGLWGIRKKHVPFRPQEIPHRQRRG